MGGARTSPPCFDTHSTTVMLMVVIARASASLFQSPQFSEKEKKATRKKTRAMTDLLVSEKFRPLASEIVWPQVGKEGSASS